MNGGRRDEGNDRNGDQRQPSGEPVHQDGVPSSPSAVLLAGEEVCLSYIAPDAPQKKKVKEHPDKIVGEELLEPPPKAEGLGQEFPFIRAERLSDDIEHKGQNDAVVPCIEKGLPE